MTRRDLAFAIADGVPFVNDQQNARSLWQVCLRTQNTLWVQEWGGVRRDGGREWGWADVGCEEWGSNFAPQL